MIVAHCGALRGGENSCACAAHTCAADFRVPQQRGESHVFVRRFRRIVERYGGENSCACAAHTCAPDFRVPQQRFESGGRIHVHVHVRRTFVCRSTDMSRTYLCTDSGASWSASLRRGRIHVHVLHTHVRRTSVCRSRDLSRGGEFMCMYMCAGLLRAAAQI